MESLPVDLLQVKLEVVENGDEQEQQLINLVEQATTVSDQSDEDNVNLELLKVELSQARQVISQQKLKLEKSLARSTELEERIRHQNDLLTKMEEDHETQKAVSEAEKDALRKLLEDERRKRITAQKKLARMELHGGNIGASGNFREEGDEYEVDSDIEVVEVVETNSSGVGSGNRGRKEPIVTCSICGASFNKGRKLIEHVQECHLLRLGEDNDEAGESDWQAQPSLLQTTPQPKFPPRSRRSPTSVETITLFDGTPTLSGSIGQGQGHSNDEKKFPCDLCGDAFAIFSRLKKHKEQAHDIYDDKFAIGCKDCGMVFSTRSEHHFHRRDAHGTKYSYAKVNPALVQEDGSPPSTSGMSNNGPSTLSPAQHGIAPKLVRNTYGAYIHYCVCGRSFRTPRNLQEHIRLNKAAPQYQPQRRRVTVTTNPSGSPCKNHSLLVPDPKEMEALYPCSCGLIYYSRPSFLSHCRSKNTGSIFQCNLCPRKFDQHGNLKNHVRQVHKVNYGLGHYGCGKCALTFNSRGMLMRHRLYLCKNRNSSGN